MNYKPSEPFTVPLKFYKPITTVSKGVVKKTISSDGNLFYCSFKSFGGTEKVVNDLIVVEDTAIIETWFNPDITSDCIIEDVEGLKYEILGTPENINKRNQFMKFKIRAIQGGV